MARANQDRLKTAAVLALGLMLVIATGAYAAYAEDPPFSGKVNPALLHLPAAQRHRAQHPAGPRALERQLLRLPEHRGEERRVAEDGPVVVAEHVAASEEEAAALRRRLSISSRVRTTRSRAT